ncbi:MAG: outer membrane protein assembly factor BamC [Methylococcales bacterium]|nr:outer membrane protein assembly factor BamC [Methylococcales bacterium]
MKIKTGSLFVTLTALLCLPACSQIKALFPDKEKDYQYTTEIPDMILPDDLKKNQIPELSKTAPSAPPSDTDADAATPPVAVNAPAEESASAAPAANESAAPSPAVAATLENNPEIPDTAIKIERIKFNEGENRLHINVPFARAWRIVGKALSRNSIEVSKRDQEERLYTILYSPDEHKIKDDSYWDDIVFLFRGIQTYEKPYLIKLDENNRQTDITVVDEDRQMQTDAGSVKLLTVLEETIKADLAKK